MKFLILLSFILLIFWQPCSAQSVVKDESIRYQQERMVFLQWDQKKFTPTPGFLHLNPYYWLTWGLFYPNYHNNDLRPLNASGPQTQRLALVAAMNATDNKYKLQSDTVRNTALSEIANQSGLAADFDPLWRIYYSKQLKPVLDYTPAGILTGLSPQVSSKLISEGLYDWYKNELDMLRERVSAAHTTDMDRGARIMAYHRLLIEYRQLAGVWAIRTSSAQTTLDMAARQQRLKSNLVGVPDWTPQSDVQIANKVLQHIQ
ncbi:hypothetical protein SNE26_24115 [Mucilaginibacter sp. cycad4]|uniref:hypothetical protein n=1 Tax=Mucilaginibacter sp. cycad4 TaxID=3342096 RepID=UPI002AAAC032|nr:hypothetical protein [Mucilaginibacter gossypii]WPU99102.1 hypothetical protein SNE26_24115 [Mucilaginibacter gossypii]